VRGGALPFGWLWLTAGCDVVSGLADFGVGPALEPGSTTSSSGGSGGAPAAGGGGTAASGGGGDATGGGAPHCSALVPCTGQPPFWDDFAEGGLAPDYDVISFTNEVHIAETRGELQVVVDPGANDAWGRVETWDRFDITGCGVMVKQLSNALVAGEVSDFFLARDDNNRVGFVLNGPSLVFQVVVDGGQSNVTVPYDLVAHRWWWVHADVDNVRWLTSSDTTCWVEQRLIDNPFTSGDLAVMQLRLGAGVGVDTTTLGWTTKFDNVNVAP
jgi:hypothetical protein